MTSRQPYKEALSPRAIEAELRRSSGSQFDPGVVLAFLSVLEDPTPGQVCPETDLDWNSLLSANPSQGVFPL